MEKSGKEKSKGLSTSFVIAGRVCKSVLQRLLLRISARAKHFSSSKETRWSLGDQPASLLVEWSHARNPGGKT